MLQPTYDRNVACELMQHPDRYWLHKQLPGRAGRATDTVTATMATIAHAQLVRHSDGF